MKLTISYYIADFLKVISFKNRGMKRRWRGIQQRDIVDLRLEVGEIAKRRKKTRAIFCESIARRF